MSVNEEYFPVVDDTGKIIGRASRADCHGGSFLLHPVVHLHLFNSSGQLFLQKRSANKDIQPGKWDTGVGGHVDWGESIMEALYREVKEEIGLTGFIPELLKVYTFRSNIEHELVHVFKTTYGASPRLNPAELDDGKFWDMDEIRSQLEQNIFTPNFEQEFRLLFG